ncbi:hypothetical protein [Caldicellulosiruptor acetigenus]|uniref:hypothetical protein n=1 Tax=Caldicellulosiruptor acetigenus TaxID=301953 RepID=UPI00040063E6|nr:hypothetical protein [Caldicellulosiruptor acetigenus]WAM36065.1 hypothetical protein OTK01_002449 [Caldicellulosiruptor acetigenus]
MNNENRLAVEMEDLKKEIKNLTQVVWALNQQMFTICSSIENFKFLLDENYKINEKALLKIEILGRVHQELLKWRNEKQHKELQKELDCKIEKLENLVNLLLDNVYCLHSQLSDTKEYTQK